MFYSPRDPYAEHLLTTVHAPMLMLIVLFKKKSTGINQIHFKIMQTNVKYIPSPDFMFSVTNSTVVYVLTVFASFL